MQQLPQFYFDKLQQQLPFIKSTSGFITMYLSKVKVQLTSIQVTTANLSSAEKLAVCLDVLKQVGKIIFD